MEENKNLQGGKFKIIILILVVIMLGVSYIYYNMSKTVYIEEIYQGISIENLDVGGLTKEEAIQKLRNNFSNYNKKHNVILFYGDQNFVMTYEDWRFEANFDQIVDEAYEIGREGNLLQRYRIIKDLNINKEEYELKYSYDEKRIDEILNKIKNNFNNNSKNAIIQRKNNKFVITEEVIGSQLNTLKSKEKIKQLIELRKDGKVELVVDQEIPEVTSKMLKAVNSVLGECTTNFRVDGSARQVNIEVGTKRMDGVLIMPGQEFSVNEGLGKMTIASGYKEAPIIVGGKLVPGLGGGVCQIATTMYNAVLYGELEIIQRQNHSLPVSYVKLGRDATLAGTVIDFRFKNSSKYPVYIESFIQKSEVTIRLYGKEERPLNRRVDFESAVIEVIMPPPEKIEEDETLASGERIEEIRPLKGYKVKLYKLIYVDDKLDSKEVENFSYYKPRAAQIKVGTKPEKIIQQIPEEMLKNTEEVIPQEINEEINEETNEEINEEINEETIQEFSEE